MFQEKRQQQQGPNTYRTSNTRTFTRHGAYTKTI